MSGATSEKHIQIARNVLEMNADVSKSYAGLILPTRGSKGTTISAAKILKWVQFYFDWA